jgi:hypothetical protein
LALAFSALFAFTGWLVEADLATGAGVVFCEVAASAGMANTDTASSAAETVCLKKFPKSRKKCRGNDRQE